MSRRGRGGARGLERDDAENKQEGEGVPLLGEQADERAPESMLMMDHPDLANDMTQLQMCCPAPLPGAAMCLVPCLWLCAFQQVQVKQEKVLLSVGKYQGTLREPGCYCVNPCCLQVREVSTAMNSQDLQNVKVADGKGNPLLISGVVTYKVRNSKSAALDVNNYSEFINTQGTTVMKRVASMYPYEAKGNEPSLKTEAEHLRLQLMQHLQERVTHAGLLIVNFELNDLAYAPEVAQQMLVRQQAEAVVDARKVIASGAVEIAVETLKGLEANKVKMSADEAARLATNLVVVICGEGRAQPTMNVGGGK